MVQAPPAGVPGRVVVVLVVVVVVETVGGRVVVVVLVGGFGRHTQDVSTNATPATAAAARP
jgi:hypothetical protein